VLDSPTLRTARVPTSRLVLVFAGLVGVGIACSVAAPLFDRASNPGATSPGPISFLGVGLPVLALTASLFYWGLRGLVPKTAVFVAAALGYNVLLVAVKLGLGPLAIYMQDAVNRQHSLPPGKLGEDPGYQILGLPIAYPGAAAATAALYALVFLVLYLVFNSGLQRRLGIPVRLEQRFITLLVVMFVLAGVGAITIAGLFGFLEYAYNALFGAIGLLIAAALVGAIALCSLAFREAAAQAELARNVTLLTTFAWVGLAFIAAYHILWLFFMLTLISLWPLKPWNYVSGAK
jgi:hypothetical protein